MESARLFEETAKRAERDRKVLEITSKIRSTTDFNEMLEIAVNELKRELNASGAQVILQQNISLKDQDHEPDMTMVTIYKMLQPITNITGLRSKQRAGAKICQPIQYSTD